MSSSDALFLSGAGATNGAAAQAFFKTVWAAGFTQPSNAPDTYSLPVVFTLSAPQPADATPNSTLYSLNGPTI